MLNKLFSSGIIVMHLRVTNFYWGNFINAEVQLSQPFSLGAIVMHLGASTEFPFEDQTYILDIFAGRIAHQSLRRKYLHSSTFPSISMVFQTNAI